MPEIPKPPEIYGTRSDPSRRSFRRCPIRLEKCHRLSLDRSSAFAFFGDCTYAPLTLHVLRLATDAAVTLGRPEFMGTAPPPPPPRFGPQRNRQKQKGCSVRDLNS